MMTATPTQGRGGAAAPLDKEYDSTLAGIKGTVDLCMMEVVQHLKRCPNVQRGNGKESSSPCSHPSPTDSLDSRREPLQTGKGGVNKSQEKVMDKNGSVSVNHKAAIASQEKAKDENAAVGEKREAASASQLKVKDMNALVGVKREAASVIQLKMKDINALFGVKREAASSTDSLQSSTENMHQKALLGDNSEEGHLEKKRKMELTLLETQIAAATFQRNYYQKLYEDLPKKSS